MLEQVKQQFQAVSWLLPPALIGLGLRLYQIKLQILADDEWHALHALLTGSYTEVLTHFGHADSCIPLTIAYKLAYDIYGLSELIMRAPVLLFGTATVIVFPLVVRRWIGIPAARAFAWLLAISPMLIFYSRYARPYAISTFLSFVAVLAFFHWWSGAKARWKTVFVVGGILAPYFHLSAIFTLGGTFLFAVTELCLGGTPENRRWKELLPPFTAVGIGLALVLGPPLIIDTTALTGKVSTDGVVSETLTGAITLFLGTRSLPAALLFLLAACTGGLLLIRRNQRFGAYLVTLSAFSLAATSVIAPHAIQVPIVFARYNIFLIPVLLLTMSVLLGEVETRISSLLRWYQSGFLSAAVVLLLVYAGPIRQVYYYPNNWTNHALFQYFYELSKPGNLYSYLTTPYRIPEFYQRLSEQPAGSLLLLEVPWFYEWNNNFYPHYQRVHRQKMLVGFVDDPASWTRPGEYPRHDYRMRFRNFVHVSDRKKIQRAGVRYVVFHKELAVELPYLISAVAPEVIHWVEEYRSRFGEPVYEDLDLVVFDLNSGGAE